jgi:hypothetical protein
MTSIPCRGGVELLSVRLFPWWLAISVLLSVEADPKIWGISPWCGGGDGRAVEHGETKMAKRLFACVVGFAFPLLVSTQEKDDDGKRGALASALVPCTTVREREAKKQPMVAPSVALIR